MPRLFLIHSEYRILTVCSDVSQEPAVSNLVRMQQVHMYQVHDVTSQKRGNCFLSPQMWHVARQLWLKFQFVWDVTSCRFVNSNRRFGGLFCLLQSNISESIMPDVSVQVWWKWCYEYWTSHWLCTSDSDAMQYASGSNFSFVQSALQSVTEVASACITSCRFICSFCHTNVYIALVLCNTVGSKPFTSSPCRFARTQYSCTKQTNFLLLLQFCAPRSQGKGR
jgi:hypothetical protein